MSDDKPNNVLNELKRRAEEVKYGTITAQFKIHEGKILGGEIIEQRIKLG